MVLGPFATWEYIKKISGAIPVMRSVKDHVEAEFNHFCRGKSHTDPGKEADIDLLQKSYRSTKAHLYCAGRTLPDVAKAKDYIHDGSQTTKLQATIDRWNDKQLKVRETVHQQSCKLLTPLTRLASASEASERSGCQRHRPVHVHTVIHSDAHCKPMRRL